MAQTFADDHKIDELVAKVPSGKQTDAEICWNRAMKCMQFARYLHQILFIVPCVISVPSNQYSEW